MAKENIMKHGSTLFAALVMSALMAPAFSAPDFLLEIEGVKGESTAAKAPRKATPPVLKAGEMPSAPTDAQPAASRLCAPHKNRRRQCCYPQCRKYANGKPLVEPQHTGAIGAGFSSLSA
jgi:hypothetical protein